MSRTRRSFRTRRRDVPVDFTRKMILRFSIRSRRRVRPSGDHTAVDMIDGCDRVRGATYPLGRERIPLRGREGGKEIRFFHRSRLPNDREAHNNRGDCIIAGRDISRRYNRSPSRRRLAAAPIRPYSSILDVINERDFARSSFLLTIHPGANKRRNQTGRIRLLHSQRQPTLLNSLTLNLTQIKSFLITSNSPLRLLGIVKFDTRNLINSARR